MIHFYSVILYSVDNYVVVLYKIKFLDRCVPILKYMGDHPSRRGRVANELTDQIFEPPLRTVSIDNLLLYKFNYWWLIFMLKTLCVVQSFCDILFDHVILLCKSILCFVKFFLPKHWILKLIFFYTNISLYLNNMRILC